MAALAQGEDDALLLVRIDLGEDVRRLGALGHSAVAHLAQVAAGERHRRCDPHRTRQVDRHRQVVARDHLEADPRGGNLARVRPAPSWVDR